MEPAVDGKAAYPAEVMITYGASHMRAAFVFLNERTAFRAVGGQAIRLVATPLFDAHVSRTAAPFAVVLLAANLACVAFADLACDAAAPASVPQINHTLAVKLRAKRQVIAILGNETVLQKAHVLIVNIMTAECQHVLLRCLRLTAMLRAHELLKALLLLDERD